jgi:hypothetical protein
MSTIRTLADSEIWSNSVDPAATLSVTQMIQTFCISPARLRTV